VALVLLVIFSIILVVSCIYQSKRGSNTSESQHRILRCGGCRRAFRVTASVDGDEFMCSRCVTEGRRRMSVVLEEERVARFARMREAANKSVKLERVTSTFFKIGPMRSKSGTNLSTPVKSSEAVAELSRQPTADDVGDCKICFDDQSCIVLVPCGHSGICEGCAKDLVTFTKECYICRNEIELIAKIKRPVTSPSTILTGHPGLLNSQLSALCVAPDSLHHQTSRRNTTDAEIVSYGSRRHTMESLPEEPAEVTGSSDRQESAPRTTQSIETVPNVPILPV
jgi:hypothetical protein